MPPTDPSHTVPDTLELANRNLQLLQAAAVAANEASTVEQAVRSCLDAICAHCGWPVGHYYRSADDGSELVPSGVWHLDEPDRLDAFRRVSEALRLRSGQGLPGRVLASGRAAWISEISKDDNFTRATWAAEVGLKAAFAFPVMVGAEVAGVLEFFSPEPADPDPALLALTAQVGTQLGRVVERTRAALALAQSEERMRLVVDTAGDAFIGMDEAGLITDWNAAAEVTLGWSRQEALGRRLSDTVIPLRYRKAHEGGLAHFLATGEAPVFGRRLELEALHRDGHEVPMELSIWPVRRGRSVQFNAFVQDISERRAAESALQEAKERFQTAFDDAPIGMALTDLTGKFLQANRAYCEMLGYSPNALLAMTFRDITPAEDIGASEELFYRVLTGEIRGYRVEKRYLHADGHVVWALLSVSAVSSAEGGIAYFIGQIEDISERKAAEQKLTRLALHDPLTSLPNRSLLIDRLHQALARRERGEGSVTVMFVDLDHFKLINDSFGHAAGDRVLAMVAERLAAAVRPVDTVSRLGGDEFVVLCEGLEGEGAARETAARVEAAVAVPILINAEEVSVTASVGVVMAGPGSATPEALLRDADAAMYRAKQGGKARHEVFDDALRHRAEERLRLERGLREAFERRDLRLVYQPLVDLATEAIVGVEAFPRYLDPDRGLVDAAHFIHLAEDSGLIIPMGTWVIKQACHDAALFNRRGWPLAMAVNLGARQMAWAKLATTLNTALEVAGLQPASLWLDLPETSIMQATGSTIKAFTALRQAGVRVGIGDFGSGEGSVGCLRRLPVDYIKIDRAIVAKTGSDPIQTATAASLVAMGRAFGLTTVAVGVETDAQLAQLRDMGCAMAQGNLLASAQPPDLLAATLAGATTA